MPSAYAQIRPVPPIEPPIINPPIEPPIVRPPIPPVIPPVVPPIATPEARIVTETGIVVGTIGRASVELPAQTTSTTTTGRSTAATSAVYRWTILNGKLLSDPADAVAEFTSTTTGNLTLGVSVTAEGVSYSTSTRVAVMASSLAGTISVAPAVPASATNTISASVSSAVNNDRTFRWSVSDDARIVRGQNTAEVTFAPGSAGVKEVTCAVTFQNLGTVTLRSYVEVTGTGAPVEVSINEGSGGGVYPAGSRLTVMASPPARGTVFDRWVGDTAALGDDPLAPLLPQGTVTVPAGPIGLTATYKPASSWTPSAMADSMPAAAATRSAATSPRSLYHVPEGARGLVFLLHDVGGAAADWFEEPDQFLLVRDLVEAGYGVVAVTSTNRNWGMQPLLTSNPDAQSLAIAWEKITRDNAALAAKPLFVAGLGGGAQAAARLADVLADSGGSRSVAGAILLCGAGVEDVAATTRVPAFFAVARKDVSPTFSGMAATRANAALLAGRGIGSQVIETGVTPVPAQRFLKLATIDPAFTLPQAEDTWTALRSAEILDAKGYVRQVLSAEMVRSVLPVALQRHGADIAAQLQTAAAGRGVQSELAAHIIDFMDKRAAALPLPVPARIANLSMRSGIAYVGDTFGVGFTLTGSGQAAMLIRAIGPGLSRFNVNTRCLATRLEIYRGGTLVAANEGWDRSRNEATQISAATAAVGAFPLSPGALDSAVLVSLPAGNYQIVVKGVNGTNGDVLAEAFDVTRSATRISRFGALGRIDDPSNDTMVTGFVVQGNSPRTLLCRTLGPALTQLGRPASNVMPDPTMVLMNSRGGRLSANDNWGDGNPDLLRVVATRASVVPLASASRDAALMTALQPGSYTLEASASATASSADVGELMIEVSEVP